MAQIDEAYVRELEQNLNAQAVRLEGARLLLDVLLSKLAEPDPVEEVVEQEEAEVVSGND